MLFSPSATPLGDQVDPHAATHAAIRAEASGSLLGALRRHHLVNTCAGREVAFLGAVLLEYKIVGTKNCAPLDSTVGCYYNL